MRLGVLLVLLAVVASVVCLAGGAALADPAGAPQAEGAESAAASPGGDAPAAASDDDEAEATEIEVEIVGKREGLLSISPAPGEEVSEVTATEIKDFGDKTVLDAIDLTPSVFVRNQGARYENRLSIRGQAPRLVLLDGIPIAREGTTSPGGGAGGAESSFAGRILYTMPAEMIERIDIIRSANSIVYGPAGSGGAVINIVTKDPEPGRHVAGTVEYGSFDRARAIIDGGSYNGHLGLYGLGSVEHMNSNLPLGEKRFTDAFAKALYNYDDGSRLFAEFFSLDGSRTLDLSQDFSIVPARYWRIDPWREQFANLIYSKALSESATLDLVAYERDRDFTTDQYTNDTFSTVRTNWLESQDDAGADLRYSVRHASGALTRAGLQWSDLSSDTRQTQYLGPSGPLPTPRVTDTSLDRSTWSVFLSQVSPLRGNLRGSLGVRYDDMNDFSPDTTVYAGLEATVSPKTTWYANLGTGAEHPDPTPGDVEQGIVPAEATSLSAETGWTVRPDESQAWTLALFWAQTEDARVLYNYPPGEIGPLAFISKAEDLTTYGAEVIYRRRLNQQLSWFANYSYLREHVTNHNPPPIPGPEYPYLPSPPKNIAAAGLIADAGETHIALAAKYASDHVEQNRLMETAWPVDGYLVFDLTLRHPVGPGELTLGIYNLLNTSYETMPAFPRPGRNYLANYRMEW
jgi:outer membrane cobalamin receptor